MIRSSRGNLGSRLALVASLAMAAAPVLTAACSGPYESAPEKVKRPTKKNRPPDAPVVAAEIKYDDECKAKFQEDGSRVRRRSPTPQIEAGDAAMQGIDSQPDPAARAGLAVDAINKYKNALGQDPYSATATYKLAVAYALVRKKGCALALLKRLAELQKNPDFESEATRMIKSVDDEPAFKGFKKDALTAAGQ
jgi:predicted Zn-dependent protease